jgi:hypothetical protein
VRNLNLMESNVMNKMTAIPGLLIAMLAAAPGTWGNTVSSSQGALSEEINIAADSTARRNNEDRLESSGDLREPERSASELVDCFYQWNASHPACQPATAEKR